MRREAKKALPREKEKATRERKKKVNQKKRERKGGWFSLFIFFFCVFSTLVQRWENVIKNSSFL